jgi:hypothetical protein
MTDNRIDQARAGLPEWSAESERTFLQLARTLQAPVDDVRRDPTALLAHLERYVSGLPLDELDEDDWMILRTQLVAAVAQTVIAREGAAWSVRPDERSPAGYRFVLERATDGRWVDPFAVVLNELRERPIEVTRMLATAEMAIEGRPGHP